MCWADYDAPRVGGFAGSRNGQKRFCDLGPSPFQKEKTRDTQRAPKTELNPYLIEMHFLGGFLVSFSHTKVIFYAFFSTSIP